MTGPRIELTSSVSSAVVLPEEGARIQHLVDRGSGRELLLQRIPAEGPRSDFLESCAGGWDELFPNDSAWRDYPDHGLLWTTSFEVRNASETTLELAATIPDPAVEITKRVSLLDAPRRGVRTEITVTATAATGPFLWAAHPMLGVAQGWRIELPSEAAHFEADSDLPGRLGVGRPLRRQEWESVSSIPPVISGVGELVYVDGVSEASVRSPDGRACTRVRWDASFLQHLWLVVITGAYGLDDCLIIEPCTTRPYRLDEAISADTTVGLAAGSTLSWWVEVESLDLEDPAA